MNGARLQTSIGGPHGFAIPAAIIVIIVVSMLALAGLYMAQSDATANAGLGRSWKALYAADAGATLVMGDWNRLGLPALTPGDSFDRGWRFLPDSAEYRSIILRVDDGLDPALSLFRIRTVGRPARGITAQRALVTMVEVARTSTLCCDGAIKMKGFLDIRGTGGGVKVSGMDTIPPSLSGICAGTSGDIAGINIQDPSQLSISGNPVIEGAPPILGDATIADSDFTQFGDVSYAELARIADIQLVGEQVLPTVAPVVSGGECQTSVATNWGAPGDPTNPCFDYLPIIHVNGNLKLTGNGIGQGILLVDGSLEVTGTFTFYGIMVVQGHADFKGTTEVYGATLVRSGASAVDESYLRGGTQLQYSSCSAARALEYAVISRPLEGRNWFEVVE
jgi:hypothetical protein